MEIETRRLVLQRLNSGDVDVLAALFHDSAVRQHLAVTPMDPYEARHFAIQFIRESRDEFRNAGAGAMAVVPHGAVVAIGYCGLRPMPDRENALELMYALAPRFWGHGLATEAARACLDWGFENLAMADVIGMARPNNPASCRVMEKLGMKFSGMTERYYDDRLRLYRLPRFVWQQNSEPD